MRAATRTPARRSGRQRLRVIGAGFALGVDFVLWHIAIDFMGAGPSTVVGSVHVVFMTAAGWALLGQTPSRLAVWATPVVFAGVVLIGGVGSGSAEGNNPALGVVFGLATAAMYTLFLLLLRQSDGADSATVAPLFDATVGVALSALLLAPLDPEFSLLPEWPSHAWLVMLALGAQVAGWLLISHVLSRIEVWETSLTLVLQPAGTILWAYLIFGEVFSLGQSLGLVLVIGGVAAVAVSRVRQAERPPQLSAPA